MAGGSGVLPKLHGAGWDNDPHSIGKSTRYYQEIAVNWVVQAILQGKKPVLLTMATGTGRTNGPWANSARLGRRIGGKFSHYRTCERT